MCGVVNKKSAAALPLGIALANRVDPGRLADFYARSVFADFSSLDGLDDAVGEFEEGFLNFAVAFGADFDPLESVLFAEQSAFLACNFAFALQIIFIADE